LKKKSKIYKHLQNHFFQDSTQLQMVPIRCRQLQPLAATCSHSQTLAPRGCSNRLQVAARTGCKWLQVVAFSKIKMMHVCSLSAILKKRKIYKHTFFPPQDGT
jgi:hypothetical protein